MAHQIQNKPWGSGCYCKQDSHSKYCIVPIRSAVHYKEIWPIDVLYIFQLQIIHKDRPSHWTAAEIWITCPVKEVLCLAASFVYLHTVEGIEVFYENVTKATIIHHGQRQYQPQCHWHILPLQDASHHSKGEWPGLVVNWVVHGPNLAKVWPLQVAENIWHDYGIPVLSSLKDWRVGSSRLYL